MRQGAPFRRPTTVGCVKRFRDDTPRWRFAIHLDGRACQRRRLPVCRRQRGLTHLLHYERTNRRAFISGRGSEPIDTATTSA